MHSAALPPSLIEKGQPGPGLLAQVVVYDCCARRNGQHARDMLAGWSGTLMVDDYGGYKALFRPEGDTPVPVKEALTRIGYLYRLEESIRQRPAEQKRRW